MLFLQKLIFSAILNILSIMERLDDDLELIQKIKNDNDAKNHRILYAAFISCGTFLIIVGIVVLLWLIIHR